MEDATFWRLLLALSRTSIEKPPNFEVVTLMGKCVTLN